MSKNLRLLVSFATSDKLSGPLKNIVGLGQSGSEKLAAMKREARDLGRELRDVQDETKRSTGNVTQLMNRERDLADRIARTNDQMEKQTKLLKINASAEAMKAKGAEYRSAGTSDMIQGAAIGAPLILAARSAMAYEKTLALVAQKTDMNEAATKRFGRRVLSTAAETGQLNDKLMEAVDFMGGKGVSVTAMDAMLPDIARFATAWDADVVDGSKAAYAGYLSLKVPLSETSRSLEIMAAAGKAGGFEVKEMAQYFPTLTSTLASFGAEGLSGIADLSSALQVLEAKTGDGSQAANNLNNLLLFAQSKEGAKNFKKAGVDIVAVMKQAEAEGGSAIDALIASLNKITGGDTSKIPQIIGDMQAGSAARGLLESQKEFEKIRLQAFASMGMTDKEYARMSGTSEANWNKMQTAMSGLVLTVGGTLLPALTDGVKWITATMNAVGTWADRNPEAASTLVKLVGGLALLKIGLGASKLAFGTLLGPLGTAFALWQKYQLLGSIAAVFPKITMALNLLRVAFVAMTGPIGLFVMVMAAVAYGVYANWDKISAAFKTGVAWVKGAIGGLPDWLKNLGSMMMNGLLMALNPAILATRLVQIAKSGITAFKNYFGIKSPSRLMMGMGGFITEGLATGIDRGKGGAISAARAMATGVAGASMATAGLAMATTGSGGGGASGSAGMHIGQITITVQAAPGQSPMDIAQAVSAEFQRQTRIAGAAGRSSFRD